MIVFLLALGLTLYPVISNFINQKYASEIFTAYGEIKSGNIKDCLESEMDDLTWYVDHLGDLRCDAIHHDGTNHYLYRCYKPGTAAQF